MEEKYYSPTGVPHDFAVQMEKIGIAYMLTGSAAMMRYSFYADIDVIHKLNSADAKRNHRSSRTRLPRSAQRRQSCYFR